MSKSFLMLGVSAMVFAIQLPAQSESPFTLHFGGGITAPLNPTAQYAGTSGNFLGGAGYRINKRGSVVGEFLWSGLPPNNFVIHPVEAPSGKINVYSVTVNYRYGIDRIHDSRFGLYVIAGGGWYYRYSSIDKNYFVPPATVCLPVYGWWGYSCDAGGYVSSVKVAYRGSSTGGLNGGVGFTIGFGRSPWKFFTEARYHYAFNANVPTTFVPVTLGIRFN